MANLTHLSDYLDRNAANFSDQLALCTPERDLTWRELAGLVDQAATYLAPHLSNEHQEIVGLLMPNSWQHVVANLAVVKLGHIVLPIDIIFKPLEIKAVIDQIGPKFLIVDQDNQPRAQNVKPPLIIFDELLNHAQAEPPKLLRQPPDKQIASLFFTSGTTGKPKAVPNTHANHIWNIEACSKVWNWTAKDSQLISVRLSHMLGLVMGLSGGLYHGNTMYLQDRFVVEDVLEMLASGKVAMFSHGPLVYARMLEADHQKYDLSKVRLFISGSGPLAPAVWQEFKRLYGAEILEVYGTSETGRIASNLLNERKPGSPGRPLHGVDIKFSKNSEVLVKSAGVFPGYLNNPSATKKSKTLDGYWRTGDIGELVDGRLVLKGRTHERIRRYGYSVSPRDVEWVLHQDRRVKEVLVMGLQKPDQPNDKLVYFLAGDITEAELHDFCAANMPSVWRPDAIFILGSLPRTRTGKPALAELKKMAS